MLPAHKTIASKSLNFEGNYIIKTTRGGFGFSISDFSQVLINSKYTFGAPHKHGNSLHRWPWVGPLAGFLISSLIKEVLYLLGLISYAVLLCVILIALDWIHRKLKVDAYFEGVYPWLWLKTLSRSCHLYTILSGVYLAGVYSQVCESSSWRVPLFLHLQFSASHAHTCVYSQYQSRLGLCVFTFS